ncbi:glycine betaine/proline transport system substrate-binding protein [Lysinibacillus composti]|uniref:Glycine/betaine ABC transporter n=1 Tax=Lysinibacillus composti TaxID=720633 RepID=A0A3N9UPR4_9BACI|nr:glycine betaine ABC transporter substrate-binding protein [Lysinibacillus composti]MBM7609566.1 glycine betaine/proline transport system substrate-binding protein [Lysinibacillus composti]RQW73906.1 glycine/betaine ABC transporter [Lysinibacillus composti]
MSRLKLTGIALGLSLSLLIAGCGNENDGKDTSETSENSLGEALDYTITGIEPGAGLTGLSKNTLEEYENLDGWELLESSTAGMLGALDGAIKNEEPIIVTGWTPHWMFSAYDLKYLEDPKGTLGGKENIQTLVRKGLEEDMPSAFEILDRFYWEPKDMEAVMFDAQEVSFEEAAEKWVEQNADRVNEWTQGIEKVNGDEIELVTTPWDSERASANVVKVVLEEQGYKVTLTPVDPAIMFQAIATGEGDATVAPWLPTTHGSFYEKYKEEIVDLGENLKGTQNGFVVPAYMDIDSIEDLMPKK